LETVAEKTLKTIRIKWVRSGIGFTYHQKTIVRSLGLNKLNHTVVRPDTPQIRGIVAAVPHLLEIVPEPAAPAWASIPEYTVHAPAAAPAATVESATTEAAVPEVDSANAGEENESSPEGNEPAQAGKE
jgi:large subunit ribosomal protein L30